LQDDTQGPQPGNCVTGDGGWFTEGFDTLELKEAEALLDELHAWRPISKRPLSSRIR